jgi:hypothetical protein
MWFSLDDLRNMNELYTIYICICICICFFPEPSNGVMTIRVIRPNHGSSARNIGTSCDGPGGRGLLNMTWQQHSAGDF